MVCVLSKIFLVARREPSCDSVWGPCNGREGGRVDICHKHHKQRLCKIVITRVKVHFVDVF